MKNDYLFFALFHPEEDGQFTILYPDLPGAISGGEDMDDAVSMATDLLEGFLIGMQEDGEVIPAASKYDTIEVPKGDLLVPVKVNLAIARQKFTNQLIKKTLTIPAYLNELGNAAGINFSALLTESLEEKLVKR